MKTLDQLIEVHRELIALCGRKKEAIIRNRIEELMQATQNETRLVKKIGELEEARAAAIQAYMQTRGMFVTASITVGTLIRIAVKHEDKQALGERQRELVDLVENLKEANELNRQLLQQSLAYVDYSIGLLVDSGDDDSLYHHPQQEQFTYKGSSMFDRKA